MINDAYTAAVPVRKEKTILKKNDAGGNKALNIIYPGMITIVIKKKTKRILWYGNDGATRSRIKCNMIIKPVIMEPDDIRRNENLFSTILRILFIQDFLPIILSKYVGSVISFD